MPDYKALYFKLFAAIADAVEELEQGRAVSVREQLILTMQEAEEQYIREEN